MNKKLCFVMDSNPEFLGGVSIYVRNILLSIKKRGLDKKFQITCIYPAKKSESKTIEGVNYIGIKTFLPFPLNYYIYGRRVAKYLDKNRQDIINSHGLAGYFMKSFHKKNERIIHVYHGMIYNFYKTHFNRKNYLIKLGALTYMFLGYFLEKPPVKNAELIISIAKRCEKEVEELYGKPKKEKLIISGVDLSKFKLYKKEMARKKLGLKKNVIYFLYVGRGGPWRKGLDRAVKLVKSYTKFNNKIKLIVIGAEYNSCKEIIEKNKDTLVYLPSVNREKIPFYYSACNTFLCCSRYEGNPLVVGEALASKILVCCSKDIELETIKDNYNGILLSDFGEIDAQKINSILSDTYKLEQIKENGRKTMEKYSLERWSKEYIKELLHE